MIPSTASQATTTGHLRCTLMLLCLSVAGSIGAAADMELQNTVIVFGGDAAYPPFEWRDNGNATGINVDLQRAIASAGGARAEHRLGNWPDVIRGLDAGSIDVVAMFRSDERERDFLFTRPIQFVNHAIYGSHDAGTVQSVDELAAYRIAVEDLSYAHERLAEGNGFAQIVTEPNTVAALEAVRDGRADYAILAEPAADFLIASRQMALRSIGSPLWPAEYALAVRRDRAGLAQWIDQQLGGVIESGRYREIFAAWKERLADAGNGPRWTGYLLPPLIAIILLGIGWVWSLRRTLVRHAYRTVDESRLRQLAESKLDWAQHHDSDTEMPNRQRFSDVAAAVLKSGGKPGRLQVVALRLAELERTIRTLGHDAGLDAMRQFAERIRNAGFPAFGQLGRDVMVILGDKAKLDREFRLQERIGDTVQMRTPFPRVFAGAATWPAHGNNLPELLRKAESALARAIERRTGWVDFRPYMEPHKDDLQIVELFRDKGAGIIHPVFQPQINLVTGDIIGAEALARWNVPGKGDVSPGVFIPLLEDAGLIRQVTHRMIAQAVRVAAEMRRRGTPCPVSVNVTGNDLLGWKLSRSIFKALREHGGRPQDLKLELTETNVVDRPEVLQWKMRRLVKEGIEISIDDFGTGYSSLTYLSDFPVREIKIDQSFVQSMMTSKKDLSIVKSTIAMGHELGMVVVAEGVETEASLNLLRQHACDRAQGYIISRPLAETDFVKFAASYARSTAVHSPHARVARIQSVRG